MNARMVAAALATVVLGGCSFGAAEPDRPGASTSTASAGTTSPVSTPASSTRPAPRAATATGTPPVSATATATASAIAAVTKLLVVVVENHSLAEMSRSMPYTFALAERYGYADHYTATRHPSLPNYLAIASGSTHGVTDDQSPSAHPLKGPTVFGAALAAGKTSGVYLDGMTSSCGTAGSSRYAVKHNPWPYFVDERTACKKHDLPLAAFDAAVQAGALPNAGMLVPDLCHDAHDCSLATADAWFRDRMRTIVAGADWRAGRLVVVLTADEDDRTAGNRVLTVVAHPSLSHVVVHTPLTHYSLTRLYAEVTHAPELGHAAGAPSMARAFGLRTS